MALCGINKFAKIIIIIVTMIGNETFPERYVYSIVTNLSLISPLSDYLRQVLDLE